MEQNPKERFEDIKDFEYLINLVDQLDKRNHMESINKIEKLKPIKDYEMDIFIDIIKNVM